MPRLEHYKSYVLQDFYRSYKENVSGDPIYDISREVFNSMVQDYFKFLATELIDNAKEVRMPARMGILSVVKSKPKVFNRKTLIIDYKTTKEIDSLVLHANEHSDGYRFRFHWKKNEMVIPNKSLYELVMSRGNKRRLAYMIKEEHKDYIEK